MASSFERQSIPAAIKGHRHFSYGGAVLPESVTIKQYYDLTPTKKSNLRINDQLLPKPTEMDMSEFMIKAVIPKEHPYQSHTPRYAMFPSYKSPDDPYTGVRAASALPLNPLLPSSAPALTVLHKTKGSPYRHEILGVPLATKREANPQCGFQNQTKPLKGDAQVLYPAPLKTVCPNASLRDWNITLSERSVNMLRNLEKAQWLSSYQLHYTGTGPRNPIKMDDFHEKTIAMITGEIDPLTSQLRERSFPAFIPSRPLEGRKAGNVQNRQSQKGTYALLPRPRVLSAPVNLALDPSRKLDPLDVDIKEKSMSFQKSAKHKDLVPLISESEANRSEKSYEDDRSIPEFESTPRRTERSHLNLTETLYKDYRSFDETMKSGLQPRSFKDASTDVQPRSSLLELQDTFRKSEAHRLFHQSIKNAEVDLRDNHFIGRKHTFCGFNSYYLHN